jgi:prevent-host-death family protein
MRQANLYNAKAQLSELVQAALDGEEVWIAKAGKPLVRLVPGSPRTTLGGRGCLKINSADLDGAFTESSDREVAALFLSSSDQP